MWLFLKYFQIFLTFSVNALVCMVSMVHFSNIIESILITSNAFVCIVPMRLRLNLISLSDASSRLTSSNLLLLIVIRAADLANARSRKSKSRILSKCPWNVVSANASENIRTLAQFVMFSLNSTNKIDQK